MLYLKSAQPVPGKGTAYTYYETDAEHNIKRMMTAIPETNEITLYPEPKLKKVFMPEMLSDVPEEEFTDLWNKASQ
ncbi:MAG: hypothetical protein OEZ13_08705 [Spirochaetia bacterium]|nr:hypothetical protein [Spirochaetia bacterium]